MLAETEKKKKDDTKPVQVLNLAKLENLAIDEKMVELEKIIRA